jgi:hypothetical protein
MSKYFEILESGKNRSFILKDNERFDTRLGIPSNSFNVWKKGTFKHLVLLPDAKELFLKEKVSELIAYVNRSKSVQDIEVLASVKPDATTLQDAAKKRIEFLTNNS